MTNSDAPSPKKSENNQDYSFSAASDDDGEFDNVVVNAALNDLKRGDVLEVIADDPESLHDIAMLIERLPHLMNIVNDQSGEFRFIIEVK